LSFKYRVFKNIGKYELGPGPLVSVRLRLNDARSLASRVRDICSVIARHLTPALSTGHQVCSMRNACTTAPCALSSRLRSEGEAVPSSSRNCRRALTTPLCLLPHLCSFIATPLSPLHRRTSRPTSYCPVSPTSPPSRCSQPWGKSTTGVPARGLGHPPSSATDNSSLTGHLC
jgi:hypothetical protein